MGPLPGSICRWRGWGSDRHVLQKAHEDGGHLAADSAARGAQGGVGGASDKPGAVGPSHGGLGIPGDVPGVGVAGEVGGGADVIV